MPADEVDDKARDELEASADPATAAGMQVEFGGGLVTEESRPLPRAARHHGRLPGPGDHARLARGGRPAALTALIGVGIAVGGVTALTGVFELTETATDAGDDARPRGRDRLRAVHPVPPPPEHRRRHGAPEAAAQATGTAGSAVVFAGTTVVIALVGLMVVNIPFLTVMGLAAAGAVIIAVLIATTLLPALLGHLRQARHAAQPRAGVPAARAEAGPREGERALRPPRDPPAAARRGPGRGGAARGGHARDAHEARAAGRRLEADRQHRAQGLRPAHARASAPASTAC